MLWGNTVTVKSHYFGLDICKKQWKIAFEGHIFYIVYWKQNKTNKR